MKAICPISGVPFRTYDSLGIEWAVPHPIFSIPFQQLVLLLDNIRVEEEQLLEQYSKDTLAQKAEVSATAQIKDLTNQANIAIHEKQWKNPAFRLYQTKHLVFLAFMNHAELIEVAKGYAARPKPEIIDSHFWHGVELFTWACTLSNPQLSKRIPHYRVSKDNEGLDNIPEYLEEIDKIKTNIGSKYRDYSTEKKLAIWEQAIAILSRRREVLKQKLSTSHNPLVAKWALTITNTPAKYWDFWYGILSSPSTKITFEGVEVDGRMEAVTAGDLRELYDWLDDNLIRPKGSVGEYHRDDSEFYFIARQTVLDIIRTHLSILEQGTSSYRIVNAAIGDEIVQASDDTLERKAIEAGLLDIATKPSFGNYQKKIEFIRALAGWRMSVKQKLLEISEQKSKASEVNKPIHVKLSKEDKGRYEIL